MTDEMMNLLAFVEKTPDAMFCARRLVLPPSATANSNGAPKSSASFQTTKPSSGWSAPSFLNNTTNGPFGAAATNDALVGLPAVAV